jgi:predicted DNA-binding protein
MSTEREEQEQTAIRLPASWLERLDEIARRTSTPARHVTRTQALREAIYRGMEEFEKELKSEGKKR